MRSRADDLVCPRCDAPGRASERFCERCGMPLVHAGAEGREAEASERRERARKVRPQYAEGEPVLVAGARHQAEAELIQGFLLEEGIPSMLRRTRGFDVPDMLAAGPRDVLVPESGVEAAREVLAKVDDVRLEGSRRSPAVRAVAAVLAATLVVGGLAPLLTWLLDL